MYFWYIEGKISPLEDWYSCYGVEATDKIWLTCCALHNFLLEADGLHEQWDNGVPSQWEGDMGLHNERDVSRFVPFATSRLQQRGYNASGMGPGNDRENGMDIDGRDETGDDPLPPDRHARIVRHFSRDYFRGRLVEHFAIGFEENSAQWPTRHGQRDTV